MKKLKSVWTTFMERIRQRQEQTALNKREAERLDRICNPLKYRGK